MMFLSSWSVVLALGTLVSALPKRECAHTVKESVRPPRGWSKVQPAPADHVIELRIGLPQPNFATLEKHLYEVSDPFHERYGAHLSKEEVDALVAPHSESVELVTEWLTSHGLSEGSMSRSPAQDWVTVKVPVSLAEKMLDTEYHVWSHEASNASLVRTTSYSLPDYLHEHIDLIQPTTLFSTWRGMKSTIHSSKAVQPGTTNNAPPIKVPTASGGEVDASCNTTITVSCLKQLYNAVDFTPSGKDGNQIAVTGYLEQFASIADLKLFYEDQVPAAVGTSFKVTSVNGGQNNQTESEAGDEANLDTQFAFGITFPTPATFFTTGGSPPFIPDIGTPTDTNEPYLQWLEFILAQNDPPQTISTSYGDDEQTVPVNYATRVCNLFAQLGARGVSLTFSSGDGGVGDGDPDPATQECFTNDGRNATRFIAGFPASCPFVTAVGGTTFVPEVAIFFSGGGFSNVFPRPSYQEKAVTDFLDKLAPGTYAGLFNPYVQAFPDVSAQSNDFRIFLEGEPVLIGGTSASSPTFAGFVSLLNDARLSKGLPPLGFLNPLIYAIGAEEPSAFNDITVGNNPGCGTPGFNSSEGWDAVTGFGTPNFGKLKEIVTSGKTLGRRHS
ncbi:tripeptidyl peptidase A [Obba rivulosa]|uniref:tripeptidyl-peptidase II n=1 Tax=Obba rivulosa TaxID=1052685 RepID=A0A8E2DN12_9APHY|nr:tripeptidyl peptidase A [Obba rivulosa]